MRYIPGPEFEALYQQYANATSREDRRIRLKLSEIAACYGECQGEEREFAEEITKKFCEIIALLELRHEEALTEARQSACDRASQLNHEGLCAFVPAQTQTPTYTSSEELLEAFYFHYVQRGKSYSTMKDYVARIRTFVNRYMQDLPQLWEAYLAEYRRNQTDDILFLYQNLDWVIAHFDTKNENGETDKQKLNLRSALRKLNEFKHTAQF